MKNCKDTCRGAYFLLVPLAKSFNKASNEASLKEGYQVVMFLYSNYSS